MKTIKEIADELGVSKTAIRKKITDEMKNRFLETKNGTILIDKHGEELIKISFNKKPYKELKSEVSSNGYQKPGENQSENCYQKPLKTSSEFFKSSDVNDNLHVETSFKKDSGNLKENLQNNYQKPGNKVSSNYLDMLKQELEIKNKMIERLQDNIESLQDDVKSLTVALENTTSSLKAAQALHAGTLQQQISEKSEFEPQTIPQTKEIKKTKKGFWERLFGKD